MRGSPGAPARALRSAKRWRERGGDDDGLQAEGHRDIGAGVQIQDGEMIAMASKQAPAACQATAPSMTLTERRSAAVETVHRRRRHRA